MTQQISSAAVHILTGKVGGDPVSCATSNNSSMTIFSLKVTRRVQGEYRNTWYRVKAYGALADSCLVYVYHDRMVQVLGNDMSVWAYADATGAPRGVMELTAESVVFLDPPNPDRLGRTPLLPNGDIPFSLVVEAMENEPPHPEDAEAEALTVVG